MSLSRACVAAPSLSIGEDGPSFIPEDTSLLRESEDASHEEVEGM